MLLEDPNSRLTSSDLCEKLREILVSAKAEHSLSLTAGKAKPIANTIFEALLDVDQTASSNVGEIADIRAKTAEGAQHMSQLTTNGHSGTEIGKSLTVPRDRQKGKSKRIGKSQRLGSIPLGKVAHRAEVLETALNSHDKGVEPELKEEKCLIQTPSTSLLMPPANPAIDGRISDIPLTTPPDKLRPLKPGERLGPFSRSSGPQRSTRTGMVSGSRFLVDEGETGNFASPTGFVNRDGFSAPEEELPPSPPNTPVQDPKKRGVGREEEGGWSERMRPGISNSPLKAPVTEQRKADIEAESTFPSSLLSPPPALQTLDPSLDIVKVRQELENKRAKGLEAQFAPFLRRNRKDQYLGNFIKDRDIVSLLDT